MPNITPADTVRALVFSVSGDYRLSVIPFTNQQIVEMADRMKEQTRVETVLIDVIDDPDGNASQFPDQYSELSLYHAIVWNSTTGSPLNEDQQDDIFLEHLLQGILWTCGFADGEFEATVWDSYNQVKITGDIAEPMSMTIAPDGRIFLIQRTGKIKVIPQTPGSDITSALNLDVYHQREGGGLGIVME